MVTYTGDGPLIAVARTTPCARDGHAYHAYGVTWQRTTVEGLEGREYDLVCTRCADCRTVRPA